MATTLANISIKDSSSWNTYLNLIYPVGTLYFSYTSTSPATRFGGSWSAISSKFIYTGGTGTGGSNTTTLNSTNLPHHWHYVAVDLNTYSHSESRDVLAYGKFEWGSTYGLADATPHNDSSCTKGSAGTATAKSFSNMPEYQQVYCWRRTA